MITIYDIIINMIRTEKTVRLDDHRQYAFKVQMSANKIEIKKAIEEIYNVKVESVNTMKVNGKKRRVRAQQGRTTDWKKAIVTLKEGSKIEVS